MGASFGLINVKVCKCESVYINKYLRNKKMYKSLSVCNKTFKEVHIYILLFSKKFETSKKEEKITRSCLKLIKFFNWTSLNYPNLTSFIYSNLFCALSL